MSEPVRLVKFERRAVTRYSVAGFALSWGDELTLVQVFDFDFMACNGYTVIRNKDVSRWRYEDEPDSFAARVLRLKKIEPGPRPEVSLDSLPDLIASVCRRHPLVTIHRERISDDFCNIGRLAAMTEKTFTLEEIEPDATWDERPRRYRFADVTRVDFVGGYEAALTLVAADRERGAGRRARTRKTSAARRGSR